VGAVSESVKSMRGEPVQVCKPRHFSFLTLRIMNSGWTQKQERNQKRAQMGCVATSSPICARVTRINAYFFLPNVARR
jgi:hypothetical protein